MKALPIYTHLCVWHDSSICVTCDKILWCKILFSSHTGDYVPIFWRWKYSRYSLIYTCDMTHLYKSSVMKFSDAGFFFPDTGNCARSSDDERTPDTPISCVNCPDCGRLDCVCLRCIKCAQIQVVLCASVFGVVVCVSVSLYVCVCVCVCVCYVFNVHRLRLFVYRYIYIYMHVYLYIYMHGYVLI